MEDTCSFRPWPARGKITGPIVEWLAPRLQAVYPLVRGVFGKLMEIARTKKLTLLLR